MKYSIGKGAVDLLYPRDQKFSPRLQKGQAGLRLSINLDQDDSGSARIKEGRLVLSDLAAGGIELIKEFGLVSVPLEKGGALEIELERPLFDPEIVVVPAK